MGPFGMMDLFGLDLMLDSWKHPSPNPRREAFRERVVPFLTAYIENGNLGLKSGRGFYDYAAPTFREPTFLAAEPISEVASDALVSTLVRSALDLADKEVATRADIDLAWKTASGLASPHIGVDRGRRTPRGLRPATGRTESTSFPIEAEFRFKL